MKKCSTCGVEKAIADFYNHPTIIGGRLNHCKECISEKYKKRYRENKDAIKQRARNWYKKNREHVLARTKSNYNYKDKHAYDLVYKRKFNVVIRNMFLWIGYRLKKDKTYKNRKLLFSYDEFLEKALKSKRLKKIYKYWKEGGYNYGDTPTVDRINNNKDYSIDNIQFLQMRENTKKRFTNNYKLI
jgi:hypothetical protein